MTTPVLASNCTRDIVVVGGGPAGSTIAALLARKGWSVTQVEKERHPRFHIGESLLPMNLPLFERLGVLEKIAAIGVKKLGADFPATNKRGYHTFRFERTLNPTYRYAFQVKREDFDQVLFRHAAELGAETIEGLTITDLRFDADGVSLSGQSDDGHVHALRARYLVDASGRDTLLGSRLGVKRKHTKHQSAALFAHFRGVKRRPGEDQGNISVYRFAHGWVWLIPLPGELMSMGAVCWPDHLKQRRGRNAEFLLQTLRGIPDVAQRMTQAEIVGNLHATGNYSYVCSRVAGPRWIMVGDAFAFIDPIFSSGVFLAMNSAELAAEVVDGVLREPHRESALQRAYARTVRGGLNAFSWFIFRFTTPVMQRLFANPSNRWRLEEALISMLGGDVFRDGGVRWRWRVFKLIYFVTALGMPKPEITSFLWRRRQVRAAFNGGTTKQDRA